MTVQQHVDDLRKVCLPLLEVALDAQILQSLLREPDELRNRRDALRVQDVLCERLVTFNLKLEPTKTRLVAFGRFAQQNASNRRA